MGKGNISKIINEIQKAVIKHSPEILTGLGIAGMITTTVLAVKATPKALDLINDRKDELETEKLPPIEVVKTAWKCYIPATLTCVTSTACLIGASSVHLKRNAALATAYKLSESAISEYKDAVIDKIGEKKEQTIRDKIAEEKMKKNPVSSSEVFITEKGNTLCYDTISGRYFKSDIDRIKRAENAINKQLLDEMYVSLNDLYDELDLDHTKLGDELGWKIDDGLVELYFSSQLADDGTPCVVMDFTRAPKYNFSNFL